LEEKMKKILLAVLGTAIAASAQAEGLSATQVEVMQKMIAGYAGTAKADAAKLKVKPPLPIEFSAESGRQFFLKTRNRDGGEEPACAACHTDDPRQPGKHVASKKPIAPLAPAANPDRFTNPAKVERNFAKHCEELYNRDCDAAEKGNFLTYLLSVK
jgi:mono/diheme cytochrome c family protein